MALIAFTSAMNCWTPGTHIGTFRGQQYAMTAGQALLETIAKDKLVDNADVQGEYLSEQLRGLCQDYSDILGEVRGKGLYIGVEVSKYLPDPGAAAMDMKRGMLERQIIIERGGRQGSVLRVLPPLIITREICDRFLNSFSDVLSSYSSQNGVRKYVSG